MVELRKQEKEEKAFRREQVSDKFYFNYKLLFIMHLRICVLYLYNLKKKMFSYCIH